MKLISPSYFSSHLSYLSHLTSHILFLTSCFLLLTSCLLIIPGGLSAQELLQVRGAVHVHSSASTGKYSIDELIRIAKDNGIQALILTDNHLLKFEYGLFPFRHLLRKKVEIPSILQSGPHRYLSLIHEAEKRYPEMILIPGAEVIPHYYWTGSLYKKNLTMHDSQKNLLVVGLDRPEDYLSLPVAGNTQAANPNRFQKIPYLFPGLLLIPGIWFLRKTRTKTIRVGTFSVTHKISYKWRGSLIILISLLFLINNYTYIQTPLTPYETDLGFSPHQQLINNVNRKGGLTFWSMPEAKDFNIMDYGRLGKVTVMTDPYPEALKQTQDYTGFGAIYPDTITFTDPGGGWDDLLNEYLSGHRSNPPWGFGEIAYHGGREKKIHQVETVFFVTETTKDSVLAAMRQGRMYALRHTEEYRLVLEDFSVSDEEMDQTVFSGDELPSKGQGPFKVKIALSASDGQSRPLTVRLIRSGKVLQTYEEMTPFSVSYRDTSFPGRSYYRLDIGKGSHRILSNPIFVNPVRELG